MPNRIIREGIVASDRVNSLDWAEEVFYRRLLNKVDDHGLFDARPKILRSALYPLKVDRVREADISRWIAACEKTGMIVLYEAEGKPFLKVLDTRWQIRSEPKFPEPKAEQLISIDNNCKQLSTKTLSLSETETNTPKPPTGAYTSDFEAFWELYPTTSARGKPGKGAAWKKWQTLNPNSSIINRINTALEMQKRSSQWLKNGGEFVPNPATWLNQRRWEDESAPIPESDSERKARLQISWKANGLSKCCGGKIEIKDTGDTRWNECSKCHRIIGEINRYAKPVNLPIPKLKSIQ